MKGYEMLREVVTGLLVLVMLGSAVMPAMAVTEANDEILLKRSVVASLDEKGKLQLNVTWVNETINLGNLSCSNNSCCSCENDTCSVILYSVDVDEVYNVSKKGESLKLLNITIHNESFSYSFHVLAYQVEKEQYNLSVVTRIMPLNDTDLFTTMANIDPRDDKAQPVADMVFFANKTTLADHYGLLGNVLNEIRKDDNTSWIWNKARIELNDLARKIERDLAEYNVEGISSAIVIDDLCTDACSIVCSMSGATVCFIICNIASVSGCSFICSFLWGAGCAATCSYYCTGNIDLCSAGCSGVCAGICAGQCGKLGPLSYFCDKYACAPACTTVCGPILSQFC
ncbi:hypothetical protein [Archaeoglobus sp.]